MLPCANIFICEEKNIKIKNIKIQSTERKHREKEKKRKTYGQKKN
jgi:hypothetical protein